MGTLIPIAVSSAAAHCTAGGLEMGLNLACKESCSPDPAQKAKGYDTLALEHPLLLLLEIGY